MKIGVRWQSGDSPHASVPKILHSQIIAAEKLHANPNSFWTLTWLEGLPVCQLDGQITVKQTHSGKVVLLDSDSEDAIHGLPEEEDDSWLL